MEVVEAVAVEPVSMFDEIVAATTATATAGTATEDIGAGALPNFTAGITVTFPVDCGQTTGGAVDVPKKKGFTAVKLLPVALVGVLDRKDENGPFRAASPPVLPKPKVGVAPIKLPKPEDTVVVELKLNGTEGAKGLTGLTAGAASILVRSAATPPSSTSMSLSISMSP